MRKLFCTGRIRTLNSARQIDDHYISLLSGLDLYKRIFVRATDHATRLITNGIEKSIPGPIDHHGSAAAQRAGHRARDLEPTGCDFAQRLLETAAINAHTLPRYAVGAITTEYVTCHRHEFVLVRIDITNDIYKSAVMLAPCSPTNQNGAFR